MINYLPTTRCSIRLYSIEWMADSRQYSFLQPYILYSYWTLGALKIYFNKQLHDKIHRIKWRAHPALPRAEMYLNRCVPSIVCFVEFYYVAYLLCSNTWLVVNIKEFWCDRRGNGLVPMSAARPLDLALCAAQNSKWPDVARKLQNGWMCRANNFRTLFRPYHSSSYSNRHDVI